MKNIYSVASDDSEFSIQGDMFVSIGGERVPQDEIADNEIREAAYKFEDAFFRARGAFKFRAEPKNREIVDKRKEQIRQAFINAGVDVVYVESIPNEYYPLAGSYEFIRLMNPWYMVTTPIGHFKVGDRKSVTLLDWSKTTKKEVLADDLFRDEDVTRLDHAIHCWADEKLSEYIRKVYNS